MGFGRRLCSDLFCDLEYPLYGNLANCARVSADNLFYHSLIG